MNSRDYWKAREETQRQKNIAQEAEYSRRIQDIYTKMYQNIQDDINSFYVKYADAEGITLAEAKKRISKLDIDEYAAKAKRYVEQAAKDRAANHGKTDRTAAYFSDQANAEMRLYNATMKINRLELLKAHLGLEMIEGHDELEKLFGDALTQRTLDEFKRQAGILGNTILNNEKLADSIVNASFHNAEFSDRVWMAQDLMKYRLHEILTQALIKGLNPRTLASEVMPLIKKEILENKRAAAERLLRTELCRVQTDAQMQSYQKNGYDQYIFLAEPTACKHCKALDNKVFPIAKMAIGENAPPAHPNCRCSTAAYAESDAEYEKWFYETTGKHSAQYDLEQGMASKEFYDSQKQFQERVRDKGYDINRWYQIRSLVSKKSGNQKDIELLKESLFQEITKSELFSDITPGEGQITFDEGYKKGKRKNEIRVAEWLINEIGGNINLIKDNKEKDVKSPDYNWNDYLWELKNISTEKAADSAIRKGLKQIFKKPGGLIIELDDEMDLDELKGVIIDRMQRGYHSQIDIIVKNKKDMLFIWRYKK